LRGEAAPSGMSVTNFFIVLHTLVVAVLVAQVWSLVRVTRRPAGPRTRSWATAPALAPLPRGLGLAAVVLVVAYPAMTGGLGWRATFGFIPDLTIVVVAVCGLWLLTGAARIARLVQAGVGRGRSADAAGNPGFGAVARR